MNKKVIIIGPAYPLRGGLSSFNERFARAFQSENANTEIYTFSLQYPSFLFPGKTQYSNEPAPKDLKIRVKINSINPLNWLKVGRELKNQNADIIVVRYWLPFMGPCLGTILRIVKRNHHTKIICIADNINPHEKRIGDKQFTKYFIKPIDAFVTMSAKVLKDVQQISTKPTIQLVHPLYDNFGNKISKEDAGKFLKIDTSYSIVLFFGFIRKYKGLDLLLQAISILKNENYFDTHTIKFLIAGEFYDNQDFYFNLIQELKIEDLLILRTEFISDSEVKYYLSVADCVIQPYRNATQSGVTPLAYHFEKPMIVTNVGGLPALVPEQVGLVCEPTPEDIASKIKQFFDNNHEQYPEAIREEKKKYSWKNFVQAIVSLSESK